LQHLTTLVYRLSKNLVSCKELTTALWYSPIVTSIPLSENEDVKAMTSCCPCAELTAVRRLTRAVVTQLKALLGAIAGKDAEKKGLGKGEESDCLSYGRATGGAHSFSSLRLTPDGSQNGQPLPHT